MSVTPSGLFSLPALRLQTLVCTCPTFQAWVGAATVDAARARAPRVAVYRESADVARPLALIAAGDSLSGESRSTLTTFGHTGSLELLFESPISTAYVKSPVDAECEHTNKVGAILAEMEQLSAGGGQLLLAGWSLVSGPARPQGKEAVADGHYMQSVFEVLWGPRS